MIRQIAIATFILCASVLGASAQDVIDQAQQELPTQVASLGQQEGPICPFAKPAARPHRRHHVVRSCPRPRPVVQKRAAPASVEKEAPVVHVQKIIEKTVIQREIVQMPTIIRQAPPAIVMQSPCGGCQAPCSRCGQGSQHTGAIGRTAALGNPGGGYKPGAPRNAQECAARGGTDTGRGCQGYQ